MTAPAPLVSVVVPTYNRADLIGETLASVLAQTMPDLEVIVADDGSTDHTEAVVRAVGDPRVRYLKAERSGRPAPTRNAGLARARGTWVAFLDSDDLWLPGKLQRQLAVLEGGAAWCFCNYAPFSGSPDPDTALPERADLPSGNIARALALTPFIGSPTVLAKRAVIEELGGFDESEEVAFAEDWELWLRLAAGHEAALAPEVLALYRLHPGQATSPERGLAQARRIAAVLHKAVRLHPEVYGPVRKRAARRQLEPLAKTLILGGHGPQARAVLRIMAREAGPAGFAPLLWAASLLGPQGMAAIRRLLGKGRG